VSCRWRRGFSSAQARGAERPEKFLVILSEA
jgi:hypothetical protein